MVEKHWHTVLQSGGENEEESYATHATLEEANEARDGIVLEYTIGFTGRGHKNRVIVQPNGVVTFQPEDSYVATVDLLKWECEEDHSVSLIQEYESTGSRLHAVEAAINSVAAVANDSGWPGEDTLRLAGTLFIRLKRDRETLKQRLVELFDQVTAT